MADKKIVVELDVIERQWVEKALATLKASLVRSLAKEMAGSDIYRLRQVEIGAIDKLILKFGTAGG